MSRIICEDIMGLRGFIAKQKQAQEVANSELKKIQERIRKGETSGDDILDMAVVQYGSLEPEMMELFRELRGKVDANSGKPVLLIYEERSESSSRCSLERRDQDMFFPSPIYYEVNARFKMGFLDRVRFNVKNSSVVFLMRRHLLSTKKYVDFGLPGEAIKDLEWQLQSGDLVEQLAELPGLIPKSIKRKFSYFTPPLFDSSQILIGEEVEKYFTLVDGNITDSYCKAIDMLNV